MLKPEQVTAEMIQAFMRYASVGSGNIQAAIAEAINASGCVLVKLDKEKLRRASVLASDSQYEFVAGKDDAVTAYLDSLAAETPSAANDAPNAPHPIRIEGLFTNSPRVIMSDGSVIHSADGINWTTEQP